MFYSDSDNQIALLMYRNCLTKRLEKHLGSLFHHPMQPCFPSLLYPHRAWTDMTAEVWRRPSVLTSLISRDADCSKLSRWWAQLWHPINGIDLKGVVSVGQKVCHCHRGVGESELPREEADVGAARLTLPHIPPTFFTYDVEGNIFPASCVQGPAPVQDNWGLVYVRDNISWCGWRAWKVVPQRLMNITSHFY